MMLDVNPKASLLSRVPLKKNPGPGQYLVDNNFMSQ